MPTSEELKQKILEEIDAQKESYGQVLIASAIIKQDSSWHNVLTKIIPLYHADDANQVRKLDYENFAIIENVISIEELKSFINSLSESSPSNLSLNGYDIKISKGSFSNGYQYDSGDDNYNIGWFYKRFQFSSSTTYNRVGPLISPKLPLFVDSHDAISNCLGVNVSSSSDFGILICLPNYNARIKEVKIGPTELSVTIETRAMSTDDFYAKCYCESGTKIKQVDISFSGLIGRVFIGFRPEMAYVVLASKSKNEMLDKRQFHASWRLPKDVIIDIPEFEIKQLIEQGESNTLEFKRQIESRTGEVNGFAETIAAFSNTNGGIILLGVDDDTTVYGLSEKDSEERIRGIVRSHCIPEPKFECKKRSIGEKEILLIKVEEGSDRPYTVWQKGVYIRAGSSVRIAERYELDELLRKGRTTGYY